jgi:hypothetical protein
MLPTGMETPESTPPQPSGSRRPFRSRLAVPFKWVAGCTGLLLGAIGLIVCYWACRPSRSLVRPELKLEHWTAVSDGRHNSNTDLVCYRGYFFLVHASSPWHFGSKDCRLIVRRSPDARIWEPVAEFMVPGQDIRDPKFAIINGRLFMYVLKNLDFAAEPYATAVCTSTDGATWTPLSDVQPTGWLFWRPKSRDGKTWYVPAYWHEHGKSILLKSTDGVAWSEVSVINEGDRNDETDIEFLPDGRMIATARLEVSDSVFGHPDACTLIAVAPPPYASWTRTRSRVTRLDGPCLFAHAGVVYAVGRHNPDSPGLLNHYGSILGRKRTSLYRVEPEQLVWLSDLPSAGDTAYAGVAVRGEGLYISYYTSRIDRDYPWLLGMISASEVRMVKIRLGDLAALGSRSEQ